MSTASQAGDRWNAVLVKEVRAALRGRVFRVLFSLVAVGTVTISALALGDLASGSSFDRIGPRFLQVPFACMCVALLGFVPVMAFLSMGSEWDENTYDLLAISNLRPRQIVLGKLLGAALEAALYACTFLPVFVVGFNLRGVDLVKLLVVVGLAFEASIAASAVALAFSSLSRIRAVRVVLLAIVAGGCLGLVILASELAAEFAFSSWRTSPLRFDEVGPFALAIAGAGLFGFLVATERVTHPEENHSTPMRLFVLAGLAIANVWFLVVAAVWKVSNEDVAFSAVFQYVVTSLFALFFATERERLPRRVAGDLRARRATWLAPFLPGGARGLAFFLVCGAIITASMFVGRGLVPTGSTGWFTAFAEEPWRPLCLFAWFWALLALSSSIVVRWTNPTEGTTETSSHAVRRWIVRFAIPALFVALVFGPMIVSFLVDGQAIDIMHPLNPFWVFERASTAGAPPRAALATFAVAAGVTLLCTPRLWRGVREVAAAARAKATRTTET